MSTRSPLYRGVLAAAALQTEEGGRAVRPVLGELEPVATADPHAVERAGTEVEAGRPHDDVELAHTVGRLDPGLGQPRDGRLPEIDERHLRVVERLEVPADERRSLRAAPM